MSRVISGSPSNERAAIAGVARPGGLHRLDRGPIGVPEKHRDLTDDRSRLVDGVDRHVTLAHLKLPGHEHPDAAPSSPSRIRMSPASNATSGRCSTNASMSVTARIVRRRRVCPARVLRRSRDRTVHPNVVTSSPGPRAPEGVQLMHASPPRPFRCPSNWFAGLCRRRRRPDLPALATLVPDLGRHRGGGRPWHCPATSSSRTPTS